MFRDGRMHGTTHLGVGQEGSAMGVVSVLRPEDIVFGSHRGHNFVHCKGHGRKSDDGGNARQETGCCKGSWRLDAHGGHQKGNYGTNGVVAGSIPLAAGVALAFQRIKIKYRGQLFWRRRNE